MRWRDRDQASTSRASGSAALHRHRQELADAGQVLAAPVEITVVE
jgi:hypothetical protein